MHIFFLFVRNHFFICQHVHILVSTETVFFLRCDHDYPDNALLSSRGDCISSGELDRFVDFGLCLRSDHFDVNVNS